MTQESLLVGRTFVTDIGQCDVNNAIFMNKYELVVLASKKRA